jgi:DNA-directed RNA polymerase subunit RPC12/RpoP
MKNVVDLQAFRQEHTPHVVGKAVCMNCKHQWEAVAPLGTEWLECPACSSVKGLMKCPVQREGDHLTCDCGSALFYIMRTMTYCAICGTENIP